MSSAGFRWFTLVLLALLGRSPVAWAAVALDLHSLAAESILLGPYMGTLEDPDRSLQVADLATREFSFTSSTIKHYSYTSSRIWIRLEVQNKGPDAVTRILEVDLPGMDALAFHRITASNQVTAGPPLQRKTMYRNPFVVITVPAESREIWYLAFDNYYAMTIKASLHKPEAFEDQVEREVVLFSSYAGFIIFAVAFSLFLHHQTRHRPFVLYACLLVCFHFLYFLTNFGVLSSIWARSAWFENRAILVFVELSQIFGFYFFVSLSEFKKFLPRIYRWSFIFPIKSFLALFICLFYFDVPLVKACVASAALLLPFLIGFGIYLSKQGQRPAFFFVIGWGVALISNTIYAITLSINLAEIPLIFSAFLGHRLPLFANIIEAVFMALAIGDQFKQYRSQAQMEKENLIRLRKDLDDAKAVQAAFFTKRKIPPSLALWAEARSAERTGGDWYGYYFEPEGQKFYMAIVDVTGHGVPSALVTGAVHGTFYSMVPMLTRELPTPEARLQRLATSLNRIVHDTGHHAELVATMSLVEIDLLTQRLHYTNMGHCPAILLSRNKGRIVHIMGPLLGLNEEIRIKVKEYAAEPSDIFFFYTDGWLENRQPGTKPLSFKRFLARLESSHSLEDLRAALNTIWEPDSITALQDDSTVIAIQFK